MTLAKELGEAGHRPKQVQTTATVTLEAMAAGWTLTQIHLDVVATVSKLAQCDFVDATLRAKANCPISRLVKANISMRAKLSCQEAPPRIQSRRNPGTPRPGKVRKKRARQKGAPD